MSSGPREVSMVSNGDCGSSVQGPKARASLAQTAMSSPLRRSATAMSIYPDMSVQERAEQPYVDITASVTMGNSPTC